MDSRPLSTIDLEEILNFKDFKKLKTFERFSIVADGRLHTEEQEIGANLILVFGLPTDQEMRYLINHFACVNKVVSSVIFLNSIAKDAKDRSDFTQTFWENIEDYKSPNSEEFMKEVLLMANKLALKNYKDRRSFLANIPSRLLIKRGILLPKPKFSEKIIKFRPIKGYKQTVYVRKKCA